MGNALFVSAILHNTDKKSKEKNSDGWVMTFFPYLMPKTSAETKEKS
jgi:hypothetical protein